MPLDADGISQILDGFAMVAPISEMAAEMPSARLSEIACPIGSSAV